MTNELVESWQPDAYFNGPQARILAEFHRSHNKEHYWGIIEGVDIDNFHGVNVLVSPSTGAHVDDDFGEWSALWVLESDPDHKLGIADHRPRNSSLGASRRPLKAPGLTFMPLTAGKIILFNAHRTHWLDPIKPKRPLLIAVTLDYRIKPAHERVESDLRKLIKGFEKGMM